MSKPKLIHKLVTATCLFLGIAILSEEVAQAKPPVFLLDTQCVNTGLGRWRYDVSDVSVNGAVYTSLLFMGPGNRFASMTCRIKPEDERESKTKFQTFDLEFGMRDNDHGSPSNIVTVYLDNTEVSSKEIAPGEKVSLSLDLSNVHNISIKTQCSSQSQYCDRVYFFNAALELPQVK
jgi:hypothetical protein